MGSTRRFTADLCIITLSWKRHKNPSIGDWGNTNCGVSIQWDTFERASVLAQLVKNLPSMWQTWVLIPVLERSPGEGNSSPLQYSGLENSMDRGD